MLEDKVETEDFIIPSRFLAFLILGIILVLVGIVVLVVASFVFGSSESAGVVIFIGPFPIVLGTGPDSTWLILIGIIIATLSIVLSLVMNRRYGRA
jgi:uncharacterized membrane protein